MYCVASALTSQLSRSFPSKVKSGVYFTSGSRNCRLRFAIWLQSAMRGSFISITCIETRSVPPLTGVSCATAGVGRPSIA